MSRAQSAPGPVRPAIVGASARRRLADEDLRAAVPGAPRFGCVVGNRRARAAAAAAPIPVSRVVSGSHEVQTASSRMLVREAAMTTRFIATPGGSDA
jgi:hypothetical protein